MRVHKIAQLPWTKRPRQCVKGKGHLVIGAPLMILEVASDQTGYSQIRGYCIEHGRIMLEQSTGDPRLPIK